MLVSIAITMGYLPVVVAVGVGDVKLASRRMRHHLEAFQQYAERKPEN